MWQTDGPDKPTAVIVWQTDRSQETSRQIVWQTDGREQPIAILCDGRTDSQGAEWHDYARFSIVPSYSSFVSSARVPLYSCLFFCLTWSFWATFSSFARQPLLHAKFALLSNDIACKFTARFLCPPRRPPWFHHPLSIVSKSEYPLFFTLQNNGIQQRTHAQRAARLCCANVFYCFPGSTGQICIVILGNKMALCLLFEWCICTSWAFPWLFHRPQGVATGSSMTEDAPGRAGTTVERERVPFRTIIAVAPRAKKIWNSTPLRRQFALHSWQNLFWMANACWQSRLLDDSWWQCHILGTTGSEMRTLYECHGQCYTAKTSAKATAKQ